MSGFDEPDWVNASNNNNDTTEDAATPAPVTAPTAEENYGTNGSGSTGGRGPKSCALMGLSVLGMGLGVMMAALGVLTILEVKRAGLGDLSEPFLASYMVLFAALLFLYELMWWTPMPFVNKAMRKNFGFLYGLRGKGLYLIFVGCLCFGLGKDASVKELNWATGIAWLATGLLHWFVVCSHPDLAMQYKAPTHGLSTGTEDAAADSANVV